MSATPTLSYKTSFRTHTCGELRSSHIGQTVKLCGHADKLHDAFGTQFDLRDGSGRILVHLGPAALEQHTAEVPKEGMAPETVVQVIGTVTARGEGEGERGNPTGEVRLVAENFEVVSFAREGLVMDFHDDKLPRYERVRFRYLYLRNPKTHETFRFRTKLLAGLRRFLLARSFDEVETPVLASRWTPETADSFIVIRNRGEMFALPGRRPVHAPILMAAGYDRTFEVARRFRKKKSYGPYQQPEFDVLEMMMAFVGESDVYDLLDELMADVWKSSLGQELKTPIARLTFDEAWNRYGTDIPDLRFGYDFFDVTALAKASKVPTLLEALVAGGALRAVRVPQGAAKLGEGALAELGRLAQGGVAGSLHWISAGGEEPKVEGTAPFDGAVAADVWKAAKAAAGDLVLVAVGRDRIAVGALSAKVRAELAKALNLIDPKKHALAIVTRLPFFKYEPANRSYMLHGDPLTKPVDGDLDGDPNHIRGLAYSIVLDGVNVGGGSIRSCDAQAQQKLFAALGLSAPEIDARFSSLLQALRFGTPPHARISIGLDRLVALLRGLPNLDEVIPLPKTPDGTDPLSRGPWPMDPDLLKGLLAI